MLTKFANQCYYTANAASNPYLLDCLTSWLREVPLASAINSPLLEAIIQGVTNDTTQEAAVECLSAIFHDTRDVDEYMDVIQVLYPRILSLRPKIAEAAESQDTDTLRALTRVFSECGEKWVILVARLPRDFRGLVEAVLECDARDIEKDAISLSFAFWYEFKQLIVVEKYIEARGEYGDLWTRLVDIMIQHLEFPTPEEGSDESDLFDGDREQEEKFREFRHQMGDVLKDCCEVITPTQCLGKAFALIQNWISQYGALATADKVPHWQKLEAPLFALRAMGRLVPADEKSVLHQVIPLIVQIPDHEKLRFQGIMALARYTEWTAQHPEFLQPQLQFILAGFEHPSIEVVRAAALAFRFFGTDCRRLLQGEVKGLHSFYNNVLDKLTTGPHGSQVEMTEGVAAVVSVQPTDQIYAALKLYVDPLVERLKTAAVQAQTAPSRQAETAVSDVTHLITIFINAVQPYTQPGAQNQAVLYWQEVLPVTATLSDNFTSSYSILEEISRMWRSIVLSYRTDAAPLLPKLAELLVKGFESSKMGCFLWATDAVIREFSDGADQVDPGTSAAVYQFFEQQSFAFLRIMNELAAQELPDVIEDFYRLIEDALIYFHAQLVPAPICKQILSATSSALSLQQERPLTPVLHFVRDLLSYGTDEPNSSNFYEPSTEAAQKETLQKLKPHVRQMAIDHGEQLVMRVLTGMMFTFPRDCLQDASGVLLDLFRLLPEQTALWIRNTIALLPPGSLKPGEGEKLMNSVSQVMQDGDVRRTRALLNDFTTSYRRRNVAPREGLGRLEATKFRLASA